MRPVLLLLFIFLTAGPALAQPARPFAEAMEIRIVNVDVVVTDRKGQPLSGLTADEFVIYENGRRQTITNFAEYREADAAPHGRGESEAVVSIVPKPPEQRRLVFFIDRLQLTEKVNREEFFKGLRSFISESMRDQDEAAVFYYGTSLRRMVPMTPDRTAIAVAIDTIERESRLRTDPESMEIAEIETRARMSEGEPDAAVMGELDRRLAAERAWNEQRRKIHAINSVIQSVAGLEGRKVMILATHRLSKRPGLVFEYTSNELDAATMIDSIVDNANAASVTVYGFYPHGLAKFQEREYELLGNQAETIDSIARRTGGVAAVGGRLSAEALERTTRHLDNYYSLAYRASGFDRNGHERKIRVEVKRDGARVLARNSVIEKSDVEVAQDRLIAATLFGDSESAIRITARQTGARKSGLTTWIVPVEITIPVAQLTALPSAEGYQGKFRVMAAATNTEGDVSDVEEKEQTFVIPEAEIEMARAGVFTYSLDIKVRDTSARAVVAVWDEIARESGYAEIELDLSKKSARTATRPGKADARRQPGRSDGRGPR